jgi:hypothetical protein
MLWLFQTLNMWSVSEKTNDFMGNNFPEYSRKEGEKIEIKNGVL